MSNFNSLVIHVIQVKGLHLKHSKPVEVYASLSTAGKSNWKSKVTTNTVLCSNTGDCNWGEHCEFQLTEVDSEIHIHVNHKTVFGNTDTLGQLVLKVDQMSRYQPPTWFKLTKKHDESKEKGQIQLEYQFENKIASSVSNFSLNKIEKEKKFEKLKRKMHLIGRSKKATSDAISMASVSLSRKSSFSSSNSALAFSSPSPNQMISGMENQLPNTHSQQQQQNTHQNFSSIPESSQNESVSNLQKFENFNYEIPQQSSTESRNKNMISHEKEYSNELKNRNSNTLPLDFDRQSIHSDNASQGHSSNPKNLKNKMRQKAENLLHFRHKKQEGSDETGESHGIFNSMFHSGAEKPNDKTPHLTITTNNTNNNSRPSSIASSSGFASLVSGNLGALNETTSPEHLLNVIKHLRKELLLRENRIRDLEDYTDKLLSKIILTHPELLQVSPKLNLRK